jgi:hypothetical protein
MTRTTLSAETVREHTARAFSPDITLRWSRTMRGWLPATIADIALVRQHNTGLLLVKDINAFTLQASGLTIETIGQPDNP